MSRSASLVGIAVLVLVQGAAGQAVVGDVELLGQVYGTRPPPSYYQRRALQPDAFEFRGGWRRPGPTPFRAPGVGLAAGAPAGVLGPREGPVVGTFRFPMVLALFSDSPPDGHFTRARIQSEFFDGPNAYYKTISDFYREASGGRVDLAGETQDWVRVSLTQSQVTAGQSALPGRVGDFILSVLAAADHPSINWGAYDNDGPDGIPNSGDDDGFVDFLAVMHPTPGAECDGSLNRIWSHKWTLRSATGQSYVTQSPSANGGMIRVDDYTIQPVLACSVNGVPPTINQIGVFAHEIGHAFGLPDLYCTTTSCGHAGTGRWDLMGSGAWGCAAAGARPDQPCSMSAWSKAVLGWVEVERLPTGGDLGLLTLPPVLTANRVFRVDADDGSGDYYLLENRQPIGFDAGIAAAGMLVWRIDQEALSLRWSQNTVNNDRTRMGVSLVQADGRNDLGVASGGNRADAGDPFPGSTGKVVLHAGSVPSTFTHQGTASGLTLLDIQPQGGDVRFRALTRFQALTVRTIGTQGATQGLLTVNGNPVAQSPAVLRAAPFERMFIEAAPGAPISEGLRRGFERWSDDPLQSRTRTFAPGLEDAELVAEYGRRDVRVLMSVEGQQFGVSPGTVSAAPASEDFWFPEGALVSFTAVPNTGFGFLGWSGALTGQANPAVHQATSPLDAAAVFALTYRVAGGMAHAIEAATPQEIRLVAENGTAPFSWAIKAGRLPGGLNLDATGVLTGAAMETGEFSLTLEARDALGLVASGPVVLAVGRPVIGMDALVGLFLLGNAAPTQIQMVYLDGAGNRNGVYDLGDLRAFLLANPAIPMTVEQRSLVHTLLPAFSFAPAPGGEP